ncbi:hypothetical protein DMC47_10430, partial [Nostoc sp. 3335mG]
MADLVGYLALGTMSDATTFVELSGVAGYTRQLVTLIADGDGKLVNDDTIAFPAIVDRAWPATSALAFFSEANGGAPLLAWASPVLSVNDVRVGQRVTVKPRDIELTFPMPASKNGGPVVFSGPFVMTSEGLSIGTEVPSLRQAATRCFPPLVTNASYTRGMSQSFHIMREPGFPVISFMGSRMNGATEAACPGGTLEVEIEYPIGSNNFYLVQECKDAGNTGVPLESGALLDLTGTVYLPKDAPFVVRCWQVAAGGIMWTPMAGGQGAYGSSVYDRMDIGTSDSLRKIGGGAIGPANGICFFPIAISTRHANAAPAINGDSRQAGGPG